MRGGEDLTGPDPETGGTAEPLPDRFTRFMSSAPGVRICCRVCAGLGGREDLRDEEAVVDSLGEPLERILEAAEVARLRGVSVSRMPRRTSVSSLSDWVGEEWAEDEEESEWDGTVMAWARGDGKDGVAAKTPDFRPKAGD